MRRAGIAIVAAGVAAVVGLGGVRDALACGGLVAPNGAVRLARASTFVAWHQGVEHYMTSFAYVGDVPDVGWIVPLPAVPDDVTKGGAWTLQRLAREARPARPDAEVAFAGAAAPSAAEVLRTVVIDALDVTVLRGSGQAVLDWCAANRFSLTSETRDHILAYAQASPIFMAARYDLAQARLRGSFAGDGTPVLITMHTPRLWVPLEVLANADDQVDADVFLLTDSRPGVGAIDSADPGQNVLVAPGMTVLRQEPVGDQLFRDLHGDRNMGWVPAGGWFTALSLSAPGRLVTYDLTVDRAAVTLAPMGAGPEAVTRAGLSTPAAITLGEGSGSGALALWIAAACFGAALVASAGLALAGLRRGRSG